MLLFPQASPYEFVQRWNAIPRTAQSIEYARLLEQITPETLPEVITNKLDGMMLTNIIRAIDKQFVPKRTSATCIIDSLPFSCLFHYYASWPVSEVELLYCVYALLYNIFAPTAGQYKLSVDILLYLTKVPRFEMNAMFLGPIEKEGKRCWHNHYSGSTMSFCHSRFEEHLHCPVRA